jgi:CIC family chloride channel protein
MAVLELTANPNLMLPAMVIIVVATLITTVVFKQKSVFLSTLDTLGLKYPPDPVTLHLQRAGVASIMNRDLVRLDNRCSIEDAKRSLSAQPLWVVVETAPGEVRCMLRASDLRVHLDTLEGSDGDLDDRQIDLLEIPGERLDVANLDYRATLAEAQAVLKELDTEAVCIRRTTAPMIETVVGVVTQLDIDNYRDSGD